MMFTKEGMHLNPSTPSEVATWYSHKTQLEPRMDSLHGMFLAETLRTAKTELEKLAVINNYVRSTIRYVADERGMNAIVPRDPDLVAERKYGDCKDRAALVFALARQYGVNVSMAMLSTQALPPFAQTQCRFFNHVICAYKQSQATLFFDPTAQYCEFGNLPDDDIGARALVLDPLEPRTEVIALPNRPPSLDIKLAADPDSLTQGNAVIILRNGYASSARHSFHDLNEEKWKAFLQSTVAMNLYQIYLDKFSLVSEDARSLTVSARADLSKFVVSSGTKCYVPRLPFMTIDNDILERTSDSFPVYFSTQIGMRLELKIKTTGFSIQSDTQTIGRDDAGFSFTSIATHSNDGVTLRYEYSRNLKYLEGRQKQEFLIFHREYLKSKKTMFVLGKD